MRRRPASVGAVRQSPWSRGGVSEASLRPPAVTACAAPAGPRTTNPRRRRERKAGTGARRDEATGAGASLADSPAQRDRVGWGRETDAMRSRILQIPDAGHQPHSRNGTASGDLGKPLSPACKTAGWVHFLLLFRAFAFHRRATSWSPACSGCGRVASPCCRASCDTRRHACCDRDSNLEKPARSWTPGKLWKLQELVAQTWCGRL